MPSTLQPPVADTEVPTWKSPNELIHERINFDDTIWGFGLAGGAYYKTPLRITYVRPGSRAEMAHIYPGDVVLKINGIDSSKLTLDEAHEMILESGIHLKINVTSPEDVEDNYYYYQDPLAQPVIEEIKMKENKQRAIRKFPKVLGKCSNWSLQWPWKCKRKIIYKESNCYLVPSKFEEKHKDTRKPEIKQDDMIVLDNIRNVKGKANAIEKNENNVIDSEKDVNDVSSSSMDIKEKESITKQSISVDKSYEDQTEPLNKNEKDTVIEQNISENENPNDSLTEKNSSVDKHDVNILNNEDVVGKQNSFDNNIDDNNVTEDNSSVNKNDEDVIREQNSFENKNSEENVIIVNTSVDKIVDQDLTEASILMNKNQPDGDNVKYENSDIPGMTESEKPMHNSR